MWSDCWSMSYSHEPCCPTYCREWTRDKTLVEWGGCRTGDTNGQRSLKPHPTFLHRLSSSVPTMNSNEFFILPSFVLVFLLCLVFSETLCLSFEMKHSVGPLSEADRLDNHGDVQHLHSFSRVCAEQLCSYGSLPFWQSLSAQTKDIMTHSNQKVSA